MVQVPAFLPSELTYYESVATEQELFHLLIVKQADFILFFEAACADEGWCVNHLSLMRMFLRWGAKSFYLSRLPLNYAQRMVQAIQKQIVLLNPLLYFKAALFFTVNLTIDKQEKTVNSLMFGAISSYFAEIFKLHCFDHMRNDWSLSTSSSLFHLVEEHVLKGEVRDLWRYSETEVLQLMRQAKNWNMPMLVRECATVVKRYINQDNVIETLLQAHKEFLVDWKEFCYQFFNQQEWGLRFLPGRERDLKIEVLNFNQSTIELFDCFSSWVTHILFSQYLSTQPMFGELLNRCPKLLGVDLTGSKHYANQFLQVPATIKELNLSVCPWLNPTNLQLIGQRFVNLKELYLSHNIHLNYVAWGELSRMHCLEVLHLAGCHQLNESELKLIAQICPELIELDLEESRGVNDQGVLDVIHACHRLTILNISRCAQITDRVLNEIAAYAYQLTHLKVARCLRLSETAILNLIRQRPSLKLLDVTDCHLSAKFLEQIKNQYPFLRLIY